MMSSYHYCTVFKTRSGAVSAIHTVHFKYLLQQPRGIFFDLG